MLKDVGLDNLISYKVDDAAEPDGHCYLPETLFPVASGFVRADALQPRSFVTGASGCELGILSKRVHQERERSMIELHAGSGSLMVSAEHRVAVPGGSYRLARDLRAGDEVLLSNSQTQRLSNVQSLLKTTAVIEFRFYPDQPVAVHLAPNESILTLGQSQPRTRRGGQNRRRLVDTSNIPRTPDTLSD